MAERAALAWLASDSWETGTRPGTSSKASVCTCLSALEFLEAWCFNSMAGCLYYTKYLRLPFRASTHPHLNWIWN